MKLRSLPCAIFFDYSAASPSIAREFLWIVMRSIGVPNFVLRALQALYCNNLHFTRGKLGLCFAFCAAAGVRQGGPLSSVIFIIATDCILRAISTYLEPEEMVRAYADDIALVARCYKSICSRLAPLFRCIENCSGLALNPRKCVVVPLWANFDEGTVREWLRLHVPKWEGFQIATCGKY